MKEEANKEKKRILFSILFPSILVAVIGLVKLIEWEFDLDFGRFGILPREFKGLPGILISPLVHADINHLINNSVPILILGSSLFYFYKPIAWRVLFFSYFLTSFYTWISARYNYHIGASGLVYALFAFILFSGFIRRHIQLIAISFLVAFLYGSLIWGILPWDAKISWEGHFWGFFVGVVLAIYYRKEGPQRKVYVWEEEEEVSDFESGSGFGFDSESESESESEYWVSNSSEDLGEVEYEVKRKE